jgi:hypothetical protein
MPETKIAIERNKTAGIKVDATIIAAPFRNHVKDQVAELKTHGIGEYQRFHVCGFIAFLAFLF